MNRFILTALLTLFLAACSDTTPPPAGIQYTFTVLDKFDQPASAFVQGEEITLRMTIENQADEERKLAFTSAQLYDFEVEDLDGNLVWKWSEGQVFAQALTELTLSARQRLDYDTQWDQNIVDPTTGDLSALPVGEYVIRGYFVGYDAPEARSLSIQ